MRRRRFAILSFMVWAHHMFTTGMPVTGQLFLHVRDDVDCRAHGREGVQLDRDDVRGSMTFETPMLFAIGFIFVFTMGGFTGLILALAPIDIQVQDTYYVVAHFHYVLVAGSLFSLFAGAYYWLPKWTGHYVRREARQVALLAVDDLLQRDVFSMHLWGSRACRGAMPTTRCSLRTFTRLERWVPSVSAWRSCCFFT
jgi:cytochrome c oxidase subunit 1